MIRIHTSLVWLVLILLLATALRLYTIASQSIWFDEGWSAYAAAQPTLLDAARADLTNPPLYYMLLHSAARFFGTSEFALRWVSALLCLLTIALMARLARERFGWQAARFAALLGTLSTLLWWAAQEARMYTLLALLVVACAWAWQRLLRRSTPLAWVILWLAELAILYAHNTGPIVAIWLNVVTLLAWLTSRSLRRPDWRVWVGGQIGLSVLWLPWLNYFLRLSEANSTIASAPELSLQQLLDVWQGYVVGVWSIVNARPELTVLSIGVLVAFILLIPWRQPAARWLIAHWLLLTFGIIAGLLILGNELHGRYLTMIAPLLLIPAAAGIGRMRRSWQRILVLTPYVALFCLVFVMARDPRFQHDDARAMVQHYADTLTPADTVIAWSYADRYELAYYWERLGVQAQRITLPEGADLDTILPLLPTQNNVALNIWYTQRADYRGMLPCVLSHGTRDLPDEFTTYGMSSVHFATPALRLPERTSANITFEQSGGALAQISAHGTLPVLASTQALCIPLDMTLLRQTTAQLKAAVIVRNALGWEIARADAIFATANQRTSDMLSAGEALAAYALLRLPYGAPAGSYPVYLRLYDDHQQPNGYEVISDRATAGRDVLLGVWEPTAGDWSNTNRTTELPFQVNIRVSGNHVLLAHSVALENAPIRNGDAIALSLLWQGEGRPPDLTLRDSDGRWQTLIPTATPALSGIGLDWRSVRVPLDAPAGTAELVLPNGDVLGRYPVEVLPAVFEPPEVTQATRFEFAGVGTLIGYTLNEPTLSLGQQPEITLVWRAGDTPIQADYTIFVQLIDADGVLIAQSDAPPAAGARPTTGWRAGEYITDTHRLTFNTSAARGTVRLIAGMYDARDNQRVPLIDGQAFATLETARTLR
ncbi:MAG: glycosyltransferase family 39 protein [Chloroflexota bacterium]|nr:glycosyltransferase family 39 protein [Chloroflexota bacterium]